LIVSRIEAGRIAKGKLDEEILRPGEEVWQAAKRLGLTSAEVLELLKGPAFLRLSFWRQKGKNQFVYIIQSGDDGPVKIGTAKDPIMRVAELQTGSPYQLYLREVLVGGVRIERRLHKRFKDDRLQGEWFGASEAVLAYASKMAQFQQDGYDEKTGKVPWLSYQ
jgi:hypothetical protein